MKISQMIQSLQTILNEEGDLDLFSVDGFNLREPRVSDNENMAPEWEIPELFVMMGIDD